MAVTGAPTPAVTLQASGNDNFIEPSALAFDSHGNLWTANADNTIVEFDAAQLTTNSIPVPHVTLRNNVGLIDQPAGLAFDNLGELWVSNYMGSAAVVVFLAGQLQVSGSPPPLVVITHDALDLPFGLAFDPAPAGLPVK